MISKNVQINDALEQANYYVSHIFELSLNVILFLLASENWIVIMTSLFSNAVTKFKSLHEIWYLVLFIF